jgi:hypothetical protein
MKTIIVLMLLTLTCGGAEARRSHHRYMRVAAHPVECTLFCALFRPAEVTTGAHRSRGVASVHIDATGAPGVVRSSSGAAAHVAPSAAPAFQCLVSALDRQGYAIHSMGGWRAHGSVRGSLHPAGLALDINQLSRNVTSPHMPSNEVALANGCGLVSGAQWANGDSGHFQVGGWGGSGKVARHHRSSRSHARGRRVVR